MRSIEKVIHFEGLFQHFGSKSPNISTQNTKHYLTESDIDPKPLFWMHTKTSMHFDWKNFDLKILVQGALSQIVKSVK